MQGKKFQVKYNNSPEGVFRYTEGRWYISTEEGNDSKYLHSDLSIHDTTQSYKGFTGYYKTQEEAEETLQLYHFSQEKWVLIKTERYSNECKSYYFVGEDEGFSVMSHLAQVFTLKDLPRMINLIETFYSKIETHLKLAPSSVRSIVLYPQPISEDWNNA
jgi:hypothetical protein